MSIKVLVIILAAVIIVYVVTAGQKFFRQSRHVYFPVRKIIDNPQSIDLDFQDVYFQTKDNITLNGWFVPSEKSSKTMLVFHGNGGNISHRLQLIRILNSIGFTVFIIDYRGYGRSQGVPTEEGTYIDGTAAMDYLLKDRNISKEDIIVYGRSLGGPIAARVAAIYHPRALVLDSTFASIKELAAQLHPGLPVKKFFKFNYSTLKWVAEVKCLVIIFHSTEDGYIPYSHSQKIFENIGVDKKLIAIKGGHADSYLVSEETFKKYLWLLLDKVDK